MVCRQVVFIALLALAAPAAQAGAWLQPEGKGQWNLQATSYGTSHYFDANSERQRQPHYSKYEIAPYAEYGLTDWLTVGATAYFQRDHQSGVTNLGVADPQVFGRVNLWKGERQLVSLQPLVKFRSVFEQKGAPRGGTSTTDTELSLLYGRNVKITSDRDYLDLRAGYRHRGSKLEDQYLGDIALGLGVGEHWTIIPAVRQVMAAKEPASVTFTETGDLDYNLTKLELGVAYALSPQRQVMFNYAMHVAGTQTGNGHSVGIGYAENF